MGFLLRAIFTLIVLVVLAIGGAIAYAVQTGLKGHGRPGPLETSAARSIRALAIPVSARDRRMPVEIATEASLWAGLEHYARYCSLCHGNNGEGQNTPLGSGLYPKPPNLRTNPTQGLTDGELFYIIENGVRFTGMPAFGTGESTPAGDKQLWEIVQLVRHMPQISQDELLAMERFNPL